MSKFHEENRSFSTLDLLGFLVLVGAVCSVFGAVIADVSRDDRPQRSKTMAMALAQRLRSQVSETEGARPLPTRGPASVQVGFELSSDTPAAGRLGQDPWGNPFHYEIRRTSEVAGRASYSVRVWSAGPDGQGQTHFADSASTFSGDDIGHVEEFAIDL